MVGLKKKEQTKPQTKQPTTNKLKQLFVFFKSICASIQAEGIDFNLLYEGTWN